MNPLVAACTVYYGILATSPEATPDAAAEMTRRMVAVDNIAVRDGTVVDHDKTVIAIFDHLDAEPASLIPFMRSMNNGYRCARLYFKTLEMSE